MRVIVQLAALGILIVAGAACAHPPEEPTAAPEPESDEVTMYVGSELVDCTGVAPQQCMQVRTSPDEDWSLFYDQIEGFAFEPGYEYELLVAVSEVPNPPADASRLRYELVELVSQTPVEAEGKEAAEGDEAAAGELTLEGVTWILESYGDPAEPSPVIDGPDVTAVFDGEEGQVTGTATCNSYFAKYETEGDVLRIGESGSTMMACPGEDLTAQETAYLAGLSAAEMYSIDGTTLTITYEGDEQLTYQAQEQSGFEGALWTVTGYNNGKQAVVSVIIGTEITAMFEGGVLSGSSGCNSYHASYDLDGSAIQIGPAASTRMICEDPEGVMEQEQLYLAALESADVFSYEGSKVELRRDDGALAVSMTAAE
jgi:heat shock protein HslJ